MFCPNEKCSIYGRVWAGNVWGYGTYGKQGRRYYICKACRKTFSETTGTIFFNLKTDTEMVIKTLSMLVERGA